MTTPPPDYLPISMLNQLEYCPRRFWLMFVCGEMEVNAPILEGTLQHTRAHGGATTTEDEAVTRRQVRIGSERLRLMGVADVVELRPHPLAPSPDENPHQEKGSAILVPVEYKHGRMGKWLNDHVQLCAQAMCLEERLASLTSAASPVDPSTTARKTLAAAQGAPTGEGKIEYGEIFYWGSRRRVRVEFTPELRARTEAAITRAFELMEQGETPPPLPKDQRPKCRDCSLEPICLPEEVVLLSNSLTAR
jgi:CRISPR-associated exonuclease Cas4